MVWRMFCMEQWVVTRLWALYMTLRVWTEAGLWVSQGSRAFLVHGWTLGDSMWGWIRLVVQGKDLGWGFEM
jgi:hypothetical protein